MVPVFISSLHSSLKSYFFHLSLISGFHKTISTLSLFLKIFQVEMAWLLLFRHIAGFMRNGYNSVVTGPMIRHTANCATSTSSRMSN